MASPTVDPSCLVIQFLAFFLLLIGHAHSVSFNFSGFHPNTGDLTFEGDAFTSDGVIQLTRNQLDRNIESSVGRASYDKPVRLWDSKTGKLTDFMAQFSFVMKALNDSFYGDGIAFYIAPFDSFIPANSSGGYLGLFDQRTATNMSANSIVAVEFDSFINQWDPSQDHVGINVNSIVSVANVSWRSSIKNGSVANAWVSYNSTSFNLSVLLTYANNPVFNGNSSLSYMVDLRKILPEQVRVGFSAATGRFIEIHNILSWSFSSTLEDGNSTLEDGKKKTSTGLVLGIVLGSGLVACVLGIVWFIFWRKKSRLSKRAWAVDMSIDGEFEKGAGPKKFTYRDLARATNDFAEKGKLGEGGFGGVYKGLLSESNTEIAVKRVSKGSKQGKKEYVSEVKIISRLRHRNLVQLIGWCHEEGELLLVYEFLPNGSLDSHLFRGETHLTWAVRYKIALGLASALLYLHEEWEQCVVHRDVKSSNVMLDSNFNAKLGDFGLARLVDHDMGSQTTVLAGTMGYLAPECVTTGKASKESDVYSFGVVALEIACGRKPVEPKAEPGKVRLVEWVWDLYGRGQVVEAADPALNLEFVEQQMECLMVVGLWCCHPDYSLRPPIKQVINVLNFEAPLPSLPSKLPVPTYYAPPMDMLRFSYTSLGLTGLDRTQSSHTSSGSAYSSTQTGGSGKALLSSVGAN
ncbi:L-type lectin-domain containing receptor kinase IX.1-like [Rhodamnia argentea]|uniref:non-specific serine/threonine protein kinase n=1 Tax=Rhodamnia argentea TaxID=178133 RepID=A0A8B8P150_9MYRT|nr:L-type lectin-domain containing receptor kinase IX.1-like [Rhodamnia argentea]